ncbi:hypothetical protein [Bacteroides sp. 519]|uniref:hypothetical protein n=1 Tax=Bacteroides sp. 519 TaxID=2302937 RepID=UPI0013D314D7|nr:hypothetical protein [Bacteroides sp. 519]NDV57758.1 hypothetical protein [Bacteroides sp. 519]
MTLHVACLWNTGSNHEMQKEPIKGKPPKILSTDAHGCGGLLRSSVEVPVMGMERREQLICVLIVKQLSFRKEDLMKGTFKLRL